MTTTCLSKSLTPLREEVGLTGHEMTFQDWLERQLDRYADEPEPEGLAGQFTEVGWEPPDEMTLKEWLYTIASVLQVHDLSPILLGDLLNEGKRRFGEVYAQAVDTTTYKVMTLYHYSYVTENVPIAARVPGTTLSHMAVVAPFRKQPALQRQLLQRAVLNRWSAKMLRKQRNALISGVTDSTVMDSSTVEIVEAAPARMAVCPECGCRFEL